MAKNVMRGNFKTLLKHFCLEGSVLGLKYFYLYPDKISRCFWAVTLILIVMFACSLTRLLYVRFDEMPTRITIENQFEPLTSMPYPAIIICSPNQMTISSMNHLNKTLIDGNTTVDLLRALPQLLGFYVNIPKTNLEELARLQNLIIENRYTVPEVMGLMPQHCDNFLKRCIFRKQVRHCRELFRPVLTRQGLCCAFNSAYYMKDMRRNERDFFFQPHLASTQGTLDPLRVVVDYEPEDALPKTLFHVGAIRIMFTDWTEFPAADQTSLVFPHVEAYLGIHGTYTYCSDEVATLAPISRQCLFEHERMLAQFGKYRNSDCDHMCYVRAVEKHCRCKPVYVPRVGVERACNITQIICLKQVQELANHDGSMNCDCPRDCDARSYTVDLSLGNLLALRHMPGNPYAGVEFKESTTILQFFFTNSVYVKKKQETVMSLISLVSNLGGIFGLCMGVSVISVLEMMFYTHKAIQNCLRKRLHRALERQIRRYKAEQQSAS